MFNLCAACNVFDSCLRFATARVFHLCDLYVGRSTLTPPLLRFSAFCTLQPTPTSNRCVVQRVDEDTERVVVTLNRTTVPPSSALFLRSLLSETFAAAATPADSSSPDDEGGTAAAAVVPARPWGRLEFGATTNAVVVAMKEYGVVLKAVASTSKSKKGKAGVDEAGQLMVCPPQHAMDGVEEGHEVKVSEPSGLETDE